MLVLPESSSAVLVMISGKSLPIGNRSHANRVNSGKITILHGSTRLMPLFEGNLLTQQHEIWSQGTRDLRYHTVKIRSLPHLGLIRYRYMTPEWTLDRLMDGQKYDS